MFKRRLDVDEDQADIVDHAFADLKAAASELAEAFRQTREDLGGAFAGEKVDEAALAAVFAVHDEAVARARRQGVSALKQIHAVLDEEQRAEATSWLSSGWPGWGRWV